MALGTIQEKYIPRDNDFYRKHYHHVIYGLMILIVLMMVGVGFVLYQTTHRPLPTFAAVEPDGKRMGLTAYPDPNLLPDTLLQWASKAVVGAYTFDFVNYNNQIAAVKPYFTETGWRDYLQSVNNLITTIVQNQIFVYGVVAGTPVIANQGPLPGVDYAWRVQIPFLVSYVTTAGPTNRSFLVTLSIVRMSTNINPQGIGIDQFVMAPL